MGYALEVELDGTRYRVDPERYGRRFMDVVRQQGGTQDEPSEFSLNPNDLWRRGQSDWIFGEGQLWYDDAESIKKRYRLGTGIDPFSEKGELRLGPDNVTEDTYAGRTIEKTVVADGYVWSMLDGQTSLRRWNGATSMSTTATPTPIVDIATDGVNVYLAARDSGKTTGGVYVIASGSTAPVLLNSVIPDKVEFVMGRLMVAAGPDIYNITDIGSTTPPAPLTGAAINADFVWDAFGKGQNFILVSGHGGDLSLVYRITIREDGTALTAPVQCAQLPDGEYVTAIKDYLGVVVLGTTHGIRIGVIEGPNLTYGRIVHETTSPVTGLEPQDRFVYYGTEDAVHRLDLSRFIPERQLVPAYASYLALPSSPSGPVKALCWYDGRLHGGHNGDLVSTDTSKFTSELAQFWTGRINYRMDDRKHFYFIDVVSREADVNDSVDVHYTTDGTTWTAAGVLDFTGPEAQFLIDVDAEWIEVRFTFNRGAPTSSPIIERIVVRALPQPKRTRQVQVPIDMTHKLTDGYGAHDLRDVFVQVAALEQLVVTGERVTYKEFDQTYQVAVENVQLGPDLEVDGDRTYWEGICLLTLRIFQ